MTTQEKNAEILSAFMGYEAEIVTGPFGGTYLYVKKDVEFEVEKFSKSYDWLLPVWHKFRDCPSPFPVDIHCHFEVIDRALVAGTFTDLYDSLVNAVQWYNSIKQDKQ